MDVMKRMRCFIDHSPSLEQSASSRDLCGHLHRNQRPEPVEGLCYQKHLNHPGHRNIHMPVTSTPPRYLYHLAPAAAWQASKAAGQSYTPATYQQDGFIHLTADPQLLLGVANHFYRDSSGDWLLLVLDPSALSAKVVFEPAAPVGATGPPSGAEQTLFPHLYGPMDLGAVVGELQVVRDAAGSFTSIQGLDSYSQGEA